MHEPFTTPMNELRILRKAFQILMDVEQLTKDDELLIAKQVRAVLTTGKRQCSTADAPPLHLDLDADILQTDTWSCPPPKEPPFPGFTVEERVCQLGYRLLPKQYVSLIPRIEQRVRVEWANRFHGTPAQHQGQDWYGAEDAAWIDPMVQWYLNKFPNITHVQAGEE